MTADDHTNRGDTLTRAFANGPDGIAMDGRGTMFARVRNDSLVGRDQRWQVLGHLQGQPSSIASAHFFATSRGAIRDRR